MQSNRLRFTSIDQSASLPQPSSISGLAVIKAPKGLQKFQYVSDVTTVQQLFGNPSSTYPGIQEVIDFVNGTGYGCWVSAPGGNITGAGTGVNGIPVGYNIPSYYGGAYFTKKGTLESFYKVIESGVNGEPVINNLINIQTGVTSNPYSNGSTTAAYSSPNTIISDTIPATYIAEGDIVTLNYVRPDGTTATVEGKIVGSTLMDNKSLTDQIGLYGVGSGSVGKKVTFSATPSYAKVEPTGTYNDLKFADTTLNAWLVGAGASTIRISWAHDITSDVVMSVYQSSPRAIGGTLGVSAVDIRPTLYASIAIPYTVGGSPTVGTVTLCGILFSTTATSTSALITELTTGNPNIYNSLYAAGYIITKTSTDIFTITSRSPDKYAPTAVATSIGTGSFTAGIIGYGATSTNPNYNTATITYTELSYGSTSYALPVGAHVISTDFTKVSGQGQSLYAETLLDGNSFIRAKVVSQFTSGANWVVPNSMTLLGTRATSHTYYSPLMLPTILQAGWDMAGNSEYQNVKIAFDPECVQSMATTMAGLRGGTLPFTTFVTGIKVNNLIPSSAAELLAAVQAIATARSAYPSVTGLAYYCNEFQVTENYSGTTYWRVPVGSVCLMLATIMKNRMGGVAPMFTNEGNPSMGGQLNASVKRAKFDFSPDHLDTLDAAGVNPIVLDPMYGLMMTSHKTAQSSVNLTDWSFLGHQMSFDLCRDEIKTGVMIPQIGKMINGYYMGLRREQVGAILRRRTTGEGAIWDSAAVLVEEVNTPETKAENKFVIKVRVKVFPFSEYVELIFINVGQTSTVE